MQSGHEIFTEWADGTEHVRHLPRAGIAISLVKYGYAFGLLVFMGTQTYGQSVSIATAQFNNSRTAANLNETILKTSNVNVASFGKLPGSFSVDGQVFAQPLYVSRVKIRGRHVNALYVATMNNSIYAFDADDPGKPPLFQVNLGTPVPLGWAGTCPAPATGQLGILSTPVIDVERGVLYAVSATPSGSGTYLHRLFALSITNGGIRSSVQISAAVPGTGDDAQSGQVSMNQTRHIQRSGLLLMNGTVYAAFGSCGPDPRPYHGWVIGYDARKLTQTAVFNTSPNSWGNAIWQSGRGLVSDSSGYMYAFTGNGTWDGSSAFSGTAVKLSRSGVLVDWFTPVNYGQLNSYDLDLSSSGPLLMPDSNLIVGGGKEGVLYVLNPGSLGHLGLPVQQFQATTLCAPLEKNGCYKIHSIAYWQGAQTLYVWGRNDRLRAYKASSGQFNITPASQSGMTATYPGGNLAISAQGAISGTGIVWAVTPDSVFHAFDATDVGNELWNSQMNSSRDSLPSRAKFVTPVIANGKVFVATSSRAVVVYGLLNR